MTISSNSCVTSKSLWRLLCFSNAFGILKYEVSWKGFFNYASDFIIMAFLKSNDAPQRNIKKILKLVNDLLPHVRDFSQLYKFLSYSRILFSAKVFREKENNFRRFAEINPPGYLWGHMCDIKGKRKFNWFQNSKFCILGVTLQEMSKDHQICCPP